MVDYFFFRLSPALSFKKCVKNGRACSRSAYRDVKKLSELLFEINLTFRQSYPMVLLACVHASSLKIGKKIGKKIG